MFLAQKLIKGVLDVAGNIDSSHFSPSHPPPPRAPLAYAARPSVHDEEDQFHRVFLQLAGEDQEVSPKELMDILNRIISKQKDLKTDGFSIESCRSMVAVMDSDTSGKLGYEEFKYLWNNIKKWQGRTTPVLEGHHPCVYKTCDTDHSGFISAQELPGAFRAAGFPLNDELFSILARRYSDEQGNMDFDNYIGCLVRLDAMFRFFKTLDKDNKGLININIQEWLQLTMYS